MNGTSVESAKGRVEPVAGNIDGSRCDQLLEMSMKLLYPYGIEENEK